MAAPSQTSPNQASRVEAPISNLKPTPVPAVDETPVVIVPVDTSAVVAVDVEQPVVVPAVIDPVGLKPAPVTGLKPAPVAAAVTEPPLELTYNSTEASDAYLLAKNLMQAGDFDNAMETIGTAMGIITSQLPDSSDAVHPALGPLYYLYGTTLLYVIEESTDNLQSPEGDGDGEEDADDTQIAWENLETARMILDKMENRNDKLNLDLAQIHLRLGDLQRANGRYHDSVSDYRNCLEIRQTILGPYDRKVADTQYSLGLVCMMLAAEGDAQQQQQQPPSAAGSAGDAPLMISPELREEYRTKALTHYLEAAKSFAGQIAFMSGTNPEEIVADVDVADDQKLLPGKTTGMDEADLKVTAISSTLAAIRARVAPLGADGDESIFDLKEILDEIQETIDEAESAKQAIGEVAEIKHKAVAAAEGDGEVVNVDGSTTTIGFGAPAAAPAASAAAAPMMVVRKKNKRNDEDSKMPADDAAKKPKTEGN